jgi:hypothetical protein
MTKSATLRAGYRSRRQVAALVTALAVVGVACGGGDGSSSGDAADGGPSIELEDETGPYVDAPDRDMAMTVDAVEVEGSDILVRLRVENRDDGYLDLGVQGTLYGPLLVMHDDLDNVYEGRAVEPAGIPGSRIADLSFRLDGPLVRDAETFTLELRTQRGPLVSPPGPVPDGDGVRWRVDDGAGGSEPTHATAPRLPDLIHFWLETAPLPNR